MELLSYGWQFLILLVYLFILSYFIALYKILKGSERTSILLISLEQIFQFKNFNFRYNVFIDTSKDFYSHTIIINQY